MRAPVDQYEIICRVYHHERRALGRTPRIRMYDIGPGVYGLSRHAASLINSRVASQVDADLRVQSKAIREGHDLSTVYEHRVLGRRVRYVLDAGVPRVRGWTEGEGVLSSPNSVQ